MTRKPLFWMTIALIFFVAGFLYVRAQRTEKVVWQKALVTQGPFETKVQSSATVSPENRVLVIPPVAGRIDKFLVDEGAVVQKGQVVAMMSSQDRVALMDSIQTIKKGTAKTLRTMYQPIPLTAPASGQIVSRPVNEGQNVSTADRVFEIANRLVIDARVDESDIASIAMGQKVELIADSFREKSFIGKVIRIGHQSLLQNNITTYQVLIEPEKVDIPIRSGMSVSVYFIVDEKPSAILIPAWLAQGKQNSEIEIAVPNGDDEPTMRKIRVGRSNGEFVEVLEGLAAGETVLYRPLKIEIQKNSFIGGSSKSK